MGRLGSRGLREFVRGLGVRGTERQDLGYGSAMQRLNWGRFQARCFYEQLPGIGKKHGQLNQHMHICEYTYMYIFKHFGNEIEEPP